MIEVRVFNPFAYRGHGRLRRGIEFLLDASRLDYRMHNKLLIADDSIALVGGRNIGNQYFQMDPASQVADDDVFSAGPIVATALGDFERVLEQSFRDPRARPGACDAPPGKLTNHQWRQRRRHQMRTLASPGIDYTAKIDSGDPYTDMVSGRLPFVWATATVICDSRKRSSCAAGNGAAD